jgi:hypothetical protein
MAIVRGAKFFDEFSNIYGWLLTKNNFLFYMLIFCRIFSGYCLKNRFLDKQFAGASRKNKINLSLKSRLTLSASAN